METDFRLVRFGLLGVPILAVAIFFLLPRGRFPTRLLLIAACVLLLYVIVTFAGLRFVTVRANLACTVAAYFAYSLLAVMCLRMPESGIRFLAFVIALVPIGCGYLLTTTRVGLFWLAIIVVFYNAKPNHVEEIAPGLTCRITDLGWGGNLSYFHAAGLYQSWDWAPLLERKVLGASDSRDALDEEGASCADLFAIYQ
jgi:hypothetical protein